MKTYGGVEVPLHTFLTSALDWGGWSPSRPGRFTPGEKAPGTDWVAGWVSLKADLEAVAKRKNPCPCRESKPGRPASGLLTHYTNWDNPGYPCLYYLS
jgi:hypothetical protein